MTFNDIDNIWLRRSTILLIPIIYPWVIARAVSVAAYTGVRDLGIELVDVVKLLWNPKRKRY